MASNFGFVYVLSNECMPGIYKIGMTDRSPRQRAAELSSATAVPCDFEVVCTGEVFDALSVERSLHQQHAEYRVSDGREFFRLDFAALFSLVEQVEQLADSCGGLFCEVAGFRIRQAWHAEQATHAVESKRNARIQTMEAFFSQSADLPEWDDPTGFNGFGDIKRVGFCFDDDDIPF